jgi:hypothetical protein
MVQPRTMRCVRAYRRYLHFENTNTNCRTQRAELMNGCIALELSQMLPPIKRGCCRKACASHSLGEARSASELKTL